MDHPDSTPTSRPARPLFAWMALGLAVVGGLQILGAVLAGLTVRLDARLGTAYKIGTSLLTSLDAFPVGLVFVAVVALVVAAGPGHGRRDRADSVAALALGVTVAFSFVLIFLPVLAALSRLEAIDLAGQSVTSTIRWVLITFVVRHSGTAAIAFAGALVLIRGRIDLGPVPPAPPTTEPVPAVDDGAA